MRLAQWLFVHFRTEYSRHHVTLENWAARLFRVSARFCDLLSMCRPMATEELGAKCGDQQLSSLLQAQAQEKTTFLSVLFALRLSAVTTWSYRPTGSAAHLLKLPFQTPRPRSVAPIGLGRILRVPRPHHNSNYLSFGSRNSHL